MISHFSLPSTFSDILDTPSLVLPFSLPYISLIFISVCRVSQSLSLTILDSWPISLHVASRKIHSTLVTPLLWLSCPWLSSPLIVVALWLEMHVAEWVTPFSLSALLFNRLLSFCSSWLMGSLNSSPCQSSTMLQLNQRGM